MKAYLILALTKVAPGGLPKASPDLGKILEIFFGIVGALALLFITISGLRYVLSAGDPQRVSKAKNGIIYALVGLVIALSAEAIVAFVGSQL